MALTEEENELVQRAVQQRLVSTLREYEMTKLGLTGNEAITKEEEKNDAEGPVEEEEEVTNKFFKYTLLYY